MLQLIVYIQSIRLVIFHKSTILFFGLFCFSLCFIALIAASTPLIFEPFLVLAFSAAFFFKTYSILTLNKLLNYVSVTTGAC